MPDEFAELLNANGITLSSVFVPFSRSRNAGEKYPSLNWQVTLFRNGRAILTTDYMAGSGHCPANKRNLPQYEKREMIAKECEMGRKINRMDSSDYIHVIREPILPDIADVVVCLVMDADVLNYSSFTDWASSFGYDPASIKAKGIYDACLATGLTLRNALGDELFRTLQTAAQEH